MAYDFIDQNIVASANVQPHDDDSFYNPVRNQHTGFAFDGSYYRVGVLQPDQPKASWFLEAFGPYRGSTAAFPTYGLILLSPVSLAIYDQKTPVQTAYQLPLWMLFILGDGAILGEGNFALPDNFNGSEQGFTPGSVCYADGVISVTYAPDPGNQQTYTPGDHPLLYDPNASPPYPAPYPIVSTTSSMVVSVDFTQDRVYLDVAV